ncbi:hypothetical protein BDP27DRAFT_1329331, partial [Rhodocollybia butyracea]
MVLVILVRVISLIFGLAAIGVSHYPVIQFLTPLDGLFLWTEIITFGLQALLICVVATHWFD